MIEAHELTKRYGDTIAVHSLSFTIAPGTVTGFLGPNGAGKSTTMRMIMGLDRPTSGSVTVNGSPLTKHAAPPRDARAPLDAPAAPRRAAGALPAPRPSHRSRSAYNHLLAMAATHSIPKKRVHEVIEMTGL